MNNKIYIYSIDYLRGILAILIMFYHYMSWYDLIIVDSNNLMFRFALYGVSIFFIISGFSLVVAHYNENFVDYKIWIRFFKKRIARIYPLYWMIIILSVILYYRNIDNIRNMFIQFTISYNFVNTSGLTPGSWSIGVEIFLYILFPIIFIVEKFLFLRSFKIFILSNFIIIALILMFSCYNNYYYIGMKEKYFVIYVHNIFNHLYFFLGGVFIAFVYIKLNANVIKLSLNFFLISLVFIIFLFFLPKFKTDEYYYVIYGVTRIYFTVLSFLIFLLFLLFNYKNYLLNFFGKISYTIYLTHPLSLYIFDKIFKIKINFYTLIFPIIFAIMIASLIYFLYEMPMKNMINNLKEFSDDTK